MSEWKTEQEFDTDPETGGERLDFEFLGAVNHPLSVDPNEYKGMPVTEITDALAKLMADINPHVSFYLTDFELAAAAVAAANGEIASE